MRYEDREDAGRQLAALLTDRELTEPVVLALPRGGVPVAAPIAAALGAPLDVLVARKIGAPGQPELALGAISENGAESLEPGTLRRFGLSEERERAVLDVEREELARRVREYRGGDPLPELAGRDVLVVDDGLATGHTATAAVRAVRAAGPRRVLLVVPVGAPQTVRRLRGEVDEVVCPYAPQGFMAVGAFYARFAQVEDAEVLGLLGR